MYSLLLIYDVFQGQSPGQTRELPDSGMLEKI
jgi:hypothetical protein